jgi:OFA family oxalate/formate antiporter-like MFS transporter
VNLSNRWVQLVASLLAMIMIANLQYAWTLFVQPMQAGTGWSLGDIQFAFTLFILFQTWVQPLDGWLIDRLGPRGFISAAGLLCGLGWAGIGYATSLPALYALYCAAGMGAAFVYSGSIGSALKWFKDRRGLAAGIMAAGFGGGTALFIPVISSLIASSGYRSAFLATGIFQGLIIVIVAQFLRHPPAESIAVQKGPAMSGSAIGKRQFTTMEMLRTPQFYVMYVMFVLMATGGLLVTANAGPMAKSWGLSTAALTLAATLSPIANGSSRVFWGWSSDRLGRENTMVLTFVLQSFCLLSVVLIGQQSPAMFATTLVLVYFTWGQIYSLFPATAATTSARDTRPRTTPSCIPRRVWPRSSARGSPRWFTSAPAAGRWAFTAVR